MTNLTSLQCRETAQPMCVMFFFFQRNLTKWQKEQRKNERRIWDKDMKKRRRGKEKGWGKK